MKPGNSLAALMVIASLAGCTTSTDHGVSIPLVATRHNTGQIGNVTLADWDNKTGFSFFISGVPSGASLPLRLYTFINKGSCQQPGPVAFAMNDHVNTERQAIRGWAFSRSAPVAMQVLLSGEYSVVVRSAPDSGNVDIFCGDIKQGGLAK
ncbi:hypothetical protein AEQ67_09325 [Pseudomonas sp. RIT-PI-q]|uniref:hypothetical protein n=1 Tax=Pseudomonas sp. RIT-PI-q TaxID=1690247 RepID=UPI0006CC69A9|nr:hypothetical protein [Pseudomonas sp. RIT-PI-q]KPH00195.1 hypothetical protein AEQ67_09325 [Pseudomonas sp. RIT-PI-q]